MPLFFYVALSYVDVNTKQCLLHWGIPHIFQSRDPNCNLSLAESNEGRLIVQMNCTFMDCWSAESTPSVLTSQQLQMRLHSIVFSTRLLVLCWTGPLLTVDFNPSFLGLLWNCTKNNFRKVVPSIKMAICGFVMELMHHCLMSSDPDVLMLNVFKFFRLGPNTCPYYSLPPVQIITLKLYM